MVYSPPSKPHKSFPHSGAKPHVVSDEIDAGAIKLQPPKIRPVSRSSSPKRRGPSADNWKRPAIRAVSVDVHLPENFRTATTASTVELLTNNAGPISAPTVENLTHKVEIIRSLATTELHSNAYDVVRAAIAQPSTDALQGAITQWETPYNKPSIDAPENIQYTRLALQYLQQGRIEDAERLYKQALVVAERTFPVGDNAISRAVEDLATFYYGHGKFKQAEPFVSRLLKQRVENLSCDDWLLIRTVDQLADVYEKCGEPIQAQALYKLLLARQEAASGHNSPLCAFTLSRLADSYLRQEHFSAAESLLQTILGIQETLHGRCSIEISTTLQELASIYQKLGRYDRAAEMLERLLHILETIHGDNGLSVASCLLKLADLLTEIDMVFEAEPLYRRAQEIYRLSYGERTAAHSMFKKKLERVTETINISKLSKDKPVEQEQCSRFPAIRVSLDDMLPSKLGTGQVNRCLGHAISPDVNAENVVPLSTKSANGVETSPTSETPAGALNFGTADSDSEVNDYDFSVNSAMIAPMFDFTITSEIVAPDFDFSPTFEMSHPAIEFDKTVEMPAPGSDGGKTLEMLFPASDFSKTIEMSRPAFDFGPAADLSSPAFDFGKTAEMVAPALDFSTTVELIAPQFDFTPSFELNSSIFESADRPFDGIRSKFESNGELDSILDPFFAKELASIYETTTAGRDALGADAERVESVDQQDTILDLEPAKTLSLPRRLETTERPSSHKTTAANSKTSKIIGAEKTTKPRRLADKTVVLPQLNSTPRLSPPIPGLVTVTATNIPSQQSSRTSVQLRDTVREKPILLPEPFPSSRRRSATQTMFAVTHPGTKTQK